MTDSIWDTLSAIDCSDHVEDKGGYSYLAWTWAWAKVKEVYPLSSYVLEDDIHYEDGTMEVRVSVHVWEYDDEGKARGLNHTMWLPVLDYKNKAIQNPNAFDINTARMRCLVKCLAMFGLGHYIYAGQSMPAPPAELTEKYEEMLSILASKEAWNLRQFSEVNKGIMDDLFNMAPQGKKTQFKNDVRALYNVSNVELKKNLGILEDAVGNPDSPYSVYEIFQDLGPLETEFTLAGCNEVLRKQIEEAMA